MIKWASFSSFSTFSGFSVHLHHNFFSFNFTFLQILRFCCGTPPQTRTEKMQGLSLPRLPIASVEHNDLTDNRRLYQFAYFPIMVGKAGLEPANSGSLSKEISTGSNLVRIAGFKPAISWSRIMRSSSSCPISGYNGEIDEHRTRNLLSARQMLSKLSYNPIMVEATCAAQACSNSQS